MTSHQDDTMQQVSISTNRTLAFSDEKRMLLPSSRSYRTYVKALCAHNPSLMNLYQFLSEPKASSACRICAIDFHSGTDQPTIRTELDTNQLSVEVCEEPDDPDGSNRKSQDKTGRESKILQGRILVIEDLSKDIIELMGTLLNIDPLFFAMHLHTVRRTSSRHQTPDEATLPSRILSQDFTNISYHRIVTSDTTAPFNGKFLRNTAINRKMVFLRSTNTALAQHCASVIRIKNRKGPWLALVLVDPPIGSAYTTNDVDKRTVTLNVRNFLGTYEEFLEPPPFSTEADEDEVVPFRSEGMFDDLQRYWIRERPACFNSEDPSVQSLAYYTLRIIAAEWVKYVAVMQQCLKHYEYNHDQLPTLSLDKFDKDLRELQSWRRRTMVSQNKINSVLRFLSPKYRRIKGEERDLELLSEDFEHINSNIDVVGRRLESMLPVVMSFVQITDARRSFAETADISRLTILALIFVPLTFVSSLFSMNTQNLPGNKDFWVYFVVAIPLTALVVLFARPPAPLRRKISEWMTPDQIPESRRRSQLERESTLEEPAAYRC